MFADPIRTDAHVRALTKSVRPGDVVIDLGCGIGGLSVLACRLGAEHVYAIEPDDSIHVARQIAARNGCADRITFLQGLSTEITLPRQADVIITDLRGVLPMYTQSIPSIIDARDRLLTPGGVLIPHKDTIWVALTSKPELYQEYSALWDRRPYDLDLGPARNIVINNWKRGRPNSEDLLSAGYCVATIDYLTVQSPNVSGRVTLIATRPGKAHGFTAWFDAELIPGVGFSNAPRAGRTVYGNAFFPFSQPIELETDQSVTVTLEASLVHGDYIWRWRTEVAALNNQSAISYDQSTFFGAPVVPGQLRKLTDNHVPVLSDAGRAELLILQLMSTGTPLGEIASRLQTEFSDTYKDTQSALEKVATLSQKYSEG